MRVNSITFSPILTYSETSVAKGSHIIFGICFPLIFAFTTLMPSFSKSSTIFFDSALNDFFKVIDPAKKGNPCLSIFESEIIFLGSAKMKSPL